MAKPAPIATGRASTSPPTSPAPACSTRSATKAGPPGVPVPAQGDRATAMTLVSSILLALVHRTEDRRRLLGRHVAAGQRPVVVRRDRPEPRWSAPSCRRARHRNVRAPRWATIYRTKDDRWIQLTIVREDKLWAPLCRALEKPELLDDPRFVEISERRQRSAELAAIFSETFATQPYEHWRKALAAHEITFGVIQPAAGYSRRRAGSPCRRRGRDSHSRDAAHARQSNPRELRGTTDRASCPDARSAHR